MKSTRKGLAGIMIAVLVAFGLGSPIAAAPAQDFKLTVRVFRIPREQNFEAVLLDGNGAAVQCQAHGDVTGGFPKATLFFQTELAANAAGEAVAAAILDRVVFGHSGSVKSIRDSILKRHGRASSGIGRASTGTSLV